MRYKELQMDLEEILKSEDDIERDITGTMWLTAFNLGSMSVMAFFMYHVGVAPRATVVFLFAYILFQMWASAKWFGGNLLKPLIIIGFAVAELVLISCFSVKNLDTKSKGILAKYNGTCLTTKLAKTGKDANGNELIFFYFNKHQIDKAINRIIVGEKCENL
jgi:hypothetical protein